MLNGKGEWQIKLLDSMRTAMKDQLKGSKENESVLAEARAAAAKIVPGFSKVGRFKAA